MAISPIKLNGCGFQPDDYTIMSYSLGPSHVSEIHTCTIKYTIKASV